MDHIRDISHADQTPLSPVHFSSPIQLSSGLPSEQESDHSFPLLNTLPGPCIPGNDEDAIYDNWDTVWGTQIPHCDDLSKSNHLGSDDLNPEQGWDNYLPPLIDMDSDDEESIAADDGMDEWCGSGVAKPAGNNDSDDPDDQEELEDLAADHIPTSDADWYPWANQEVSCCSAACQCASIHISFHRKHSWI